MLQKNWLILAVAWVSFSGCFLSGCNPEKVQTAKKPTVPVMVASAVRKNAPLQLRLIGNVEAYSTISVKAQISGELLRVFFTEGKDVKKGDLLFQIDPRPYQQALRQAEAALARDAAQLKQLEANLARDMAQAKNADVQAARYAKLAEAGVISKEQNDQMRTSADALEETTKASRAAIESARAALNSEKAAVERAKLDLEYCSIHSPIDGRTGNLQVKAGNLVKANADTPLVVINQVSPIYVAFSLPEQQLADVRRYMAKHPLPVDATASKEEGTPSRGTLTFIDNAVDRSTGTIRLKATFANKERQLWPGEFVNVVLTLAMESDVTVVPSEAVQIGQQGQYGFVVKPDHTVESRTVTVGRSLGREIIVERGIAPGETVVTDGQLRLVPGASVEVVKDRAPENKPQGGEADQK